MLHVAQTGPTPHGLTQYSVIRDGEQGRRACNQAFISSVSGVCHCVRARVCYGTGALYNKYKWALLRFYFVFVESVCARVFSPWLKYWRRRGGGGRPRPARPAPRRRRGAGPHGPATGHESSCPCSRAESFSRERRDTARARPQRTGRAPGTGRDVVCAWRDTRQRHGARRESREPSA